MILVLNNTYPYSFRGCTPDSLSLNFLTPLSENPGSTPALAIATFYNNHNYDYYNSVSDVILIIQPSTK